MKFAAASGATGAMAVISQADAEAAKAKAKAEKAAAAEKSKAAAAEKAKSEATKARMAAAFSAAQRIQRIFRGKRCRKIAHEKKLVDEEKILKVKEEGMLVGGKRVKPWSEESARMAMMELNGKLGENGNVLWPKGTVEKLLIERTTYADAIKQIKRMEKVKEKASAKAMDVANQTIVDVMKDLNRAKLLNKGAAAESFDPTWTVQEWLASLDLTEVVATCMLEHLRSKSDDPKFERGFIQKVGQMPEAEGTMVLGGLLESSTLIASIAEMVSKAAKAVSKEMAKKAAQQKENKPASAGKFFDDAAPPAQAGAKPFTLTFGDRSDFFGGLEKLVGKPDPISMRAGMAKEHTTRKDARAEFTVGNYGTTTTAECEYWFVLDPSAEVLARLGIREWPKDTKLHADAKSRSLCRQAKHPRTFEPIRKDLNLRLKMIGLDFSPDMFIGARLYTGPMFMKSAPAASLPFS